MFDAERYAEATAFAESVLRSIIVNCVGQKLAMTDGK